MKRSGDRKGEFTAETRSRGEESGNRVIARDRVIGEAACNCHPERAGADAGVPNTRVFRVVGWSYATASRRTPTMPVPEHAASGSSHEAANLTAETRRRGENQKPTTEARRHGEESGDRVIGKSGDRKALLPEMMNRVMQTIRAAIREIFDESAYDRFLLRTHALRSVTSYREFTRERDAAILKKPRCC